MKKPEIKRIMIPLDFSETGQVALDHGANMASLFKADLYILHVIELLEYPYVVYDPSLMVNFDTSELEKNIVSDMNARAQKIREKYNINVTPIVCRGRVASELTATAEENKIDLIVMGTHGTQGFRELFIGSNAHKTVTASPCPVITIQTHATEVGFKDIVVPIDNSTHSRQKVDYVIMIAKAYGSFVRILGLNSEEEKENENKLLIKIESVERALEQNGIDYNRTIVYGRNIAVETMKFAKKVQADLVVIMTDHESELTGMFLGIFAKQIINHSDIPVLSIRPSEGQYEVMSVGSNPYN